MKDYIVNIDSSIFCTRTGKNVSPSLLKNGYKIVTLMVEGNMKTFNLHTLVMMIHGSIKPTPTSVVSFKNGDRSDCNIDNLEWKSSSTKYKEAFNSETTVTCQCGREFKGSPRAINHIRNCKIN